MKNENKYRSNIVKNYKQINKMRTGEDTSLNFQFKFIPKDSQCVKKACQLTLQQIWVRLFLFDL